MKALAFVETGLSDLRAVQIKSEKVIRNRGMTMKYEKVLINIISYTFGYMLLFMAIVVAMEVIARKLCGFSLQGINELSGYIMASISCLAAAVAVIGRNHIRIDFLHYRLPRIAQATLNVIAALSIAALGCLLSYMAFMVLRDSYEFQSTAATPWATPLVYPQGAWNVALIIFASVATFYGVRALIMQLKFDVNSLILFYQPKASKQEGKDEVREALERVKIS